MIVHKYINGSISEILNILCNDFLYNLTFVLNNTNFLSLNMYIYDNTISIINNIQLLLENDLLENSLNKTITNFDDFFNSLTSLKINLYYLTITYSSSIYLNNKFNIKFYNYMSNNKFKSEYTYILSYMINNIYSILDNIYYYLYKKHNNNNNNNVEINNIYEIQSSVKYQLLSYIINDDMNDLDDESFILPELI